MSNPGTLADALEALLAKLPAPTDPLPAPPVRTMQGRAKQLKDTEAREVVAAYKAGATVYQLGQRFGIHRVTVSNILKRHGVRMRMGGLESGQIEEAIKLYQEGWSLPRIGRRFGVADTTVRARLIECGTKMRPRPGRG
ncbi:Sigma-70, region 4 [Actinomadura rubteroloni]|uniref:Sigma-70, region 4 n=1 Tax=Actinomadura rubteroloni TaxID=1926885 RepID=A0A2P4UFF5_9ACTN|nr:hypothetical protein [Actinomadura rubteroloni]POM23807.1 Sigma-70, region 4 [Actinomadura rubteroloni]